MEKHLSRNHPSEDRISLLPNEILISILSLLPFKEAARTILLSRRWIHVWEYLTVLDFDASSALYKITESTLREWEEGQFFILLRRERHYYVKWVNKVLQSHKALTLDEFRVNCDLGSSYENMIDNWLRYAFHRNVRRLELNLTHYSWLLDSSDIYTFSHKSLGLRNLQSLERNSLTGFKYLQTLSLKRVNVSEKFVRFFLHNCKFLENLAVHHSEHLKKLEISGPSLALRHLELCWCRHLKSLIVCNVNLISLKINYPGKLVLKEVPMLVDFCICGYAYSLKDLVIQLSWCLSKLEVLSLVLPVRRLREIAELPQFTGLKVLTLVDDVLNDESMLELTDFTRASPNLEKFVLKLCRGVQIVRSSRKLGSAAKWPHHHLKVLELHGGYGGATELELVMYFLENAASLEEIIVNTRRQCALACPYFLDKQITQEEEDLKIYVKEKLQDLIPSQIRLTVL